MADSCGNTNSVNFRAALFICSFLIQYLQFYRFKRGVNKVELELNIRMGNEVQEPKIPVDFPSLVNLFLAFINVNLTF